MQTTRSTTTTRRIDVAVIGAGPHALTHCAHLLKRRPSLRTSLCVVDPRPGWLGAWQHSFQRFDIKHLRSPVVHHPSPNPSALGVHHLATRDRLYGHYNLPSTDLFEAFCGDLVDTLGLESCRRNTSVESINCAGDRAVSLRCSDGTRIDASCVVVAVGGGGPNVPAWADGHSNVCRHASQVNLGSEDLTGRTILVVGGGLTAAHLALGAIARGAHVTWAVRRKVRISEFDTDPGWLGPKELDRFSREADPAARRAMVLSARGGGSVPDWARDALAVQRDAGRLRWCEHTEVVSMGQAPDGSGRTLARVQVADAPGLSDEIVDNIWLATGWRHHLDQLHLLDALRRTHPVTEVDGIPVLGSHLRWGDAPVWLTGPWAQLTVGPAAGNLIGARFAAERVVDSLFDVLDGNTR